MNRFKLFSHHPFFIRLFHWEYWSFNTVYALMYPVFAWFCIKAGFKYFYSASNPSIENGGFLMEKKQDIFPLIPSSYYPAYFFVKAGASFGSIKKEMINHQFVFPLIAKPVIGMQGKAVKKITCEEELKNYAEVCTVDFLIQQFSSYQSEVGIFYYRYPSENNGCITGIVAKEPMCVIGDGKSTLLELIMQVPRYILQVDALKQMYKESIHQVLNMSESKILAPYGNHARGSKFLDWTDRADETFIKNIDLFCKQIPGFFYGRLDVMYDSWDDLRLGKNFHVIELNGAGSEPTHMYDPRHSIFFAWKEILKHWKILYHVSKQNHEKGYSYMSLKEGATMFKRNNEQVKELNRIGRKL